MYNFISSSAAHEQLNIGLALVKHLQLEFILLAYLSLKLDSITVVSLEVFSILTLYITLNENVMICIISNMILNSRN